MAGFWKTFSEKHERLKKRIHNYRLPLSPMGLRAMKVVYFTTPIIAGYWFMNYVVAPRAVFIFV